MTVSVWMPQSTHLFCFMEALNACKECVLCNLRNETFDIVSSMIIPETFGLQSLSALLVKHCGVNEQI